MSDSDFVAAVGTLVERQGWNVETSRVRADTVGVRGARNGSRLVGVVVPDPDAAVTDRHVRFLLQTASDADADTAVVAARGDLTADAGALAHEYDVTVLDADRVAADTDWSPPTDDGTAAAGTAAASDGSDDSADAFGESRFERPAEAVADEHGGVDSAAANDAPADEHGGRERSSDDPDVAHEEGDDAASANAESADDGADRWDVGAGGTDGPPAGPATPDGQPGVSRRDALKLGGAAALAAGGWLAYTRLDVFGGSSGPEQTVRQFYAAVDAGNVERARELMHEDGESLDAGNLRDHSVEVLSVERLETGDDGDAVLFRVRLRFDDSYTETARITVRRNADGDWRLLAA